MSYATQDFLIPVPTLDATRDPRTDPYKTGQQEQKELPGMIEPTAEGDAAPPGMGIWIPVPTDAATEYNATQTTAAKKAGQVVSSSNEAILRGKDSGMSWGRSGATQSTSERGAESIPPGASAALGIQPERVGISPNPSTFGSLGAPASGDGSAGNWNMDDIANGTRIG